MGMDEPRADGGTSPRVRETFHGFFSTGADPEGLFDTHECTIFVTDEELVVGDMGEYQLIGGLGKMLPVEVYKIARSLLADDDASTITFEAATGRSGTRRIALADISGIDVEQGMPPLGKTMVEIDTGSRGRELNVFVGTAKNYGDEAETKAFVDVLETAAREAGGSPVVNHEYDL